jgi:TetR/AcrR family transcriptional repressor of mexJK operon
VRAGSVKKRTAILAAARELFAGQGVDRVSMDAVAAEAKVSKATVYEYFGDKNRLFQAILADASESLLTTGRRAYDAHLADDQQIATVADLEGALTAVAVELGTSVVGSADYAAAFALVSQRRLQKPTSDEDLSTDGAIEVLAGHLAHFAQRGLLDADDPRLAAHHFNALTVLSAFERHPVPANADPDDVRQIMIDGVHAFVRAYASR